MNVRPAVSESDTMGHRQPAAGEGVPARALLLLLFCSLPQCLQLLWQRAILGQPHLCMAVPHGGVARGNCAVGKACQSPHLEHQNCLLSDEVIKNGLSRSDPRVLLRLGHRGTLAWFRTWRHRPGHPMSTEPPSAGAPQHCPLKLHGGRQGRAGPAGRPGADLGASLRSSAGLCRSIWLRSAARVPGSRPTTAPHVIAKGFPPLPSARQRAQPQGHAPWLLPKEAAPARGIRVPGQMQMDGQTDTLLKRQRTPV